MAFQPGVGDLTLGETVGSRRPFHMRSEARGYHLFVCGGTGSGKSRFLESLIRQDIRDHSKTGSGLLLIDPHGSVYDGLVSWLAANDYKRPLVLIDLRRADLALSYNPLRKRPGVQASVVVDNFVDALAFAWGQAGTDQTPQFEHWASALATVLYEKSYTLADASHMFKRRSATLRRVMTRQLQDDDAADAWEYANSLSAKDFTAEVGSTLRRFGRFTRNPLLRTIFGQTEATLDLREALAEGHIVLVSLGRMGAQISDRDARTFATLLLSDLWNAAQETRDKSKKPRPFRVYLDEFQRFVTPSMADGLAQARGFGLHLTLAQQFPNQLLARGEHGRNLFGEVMENASSLVTFRLQDPENLKPLAQKLFTGVLDPQEVKHRTEATRVVNYVEEEREDQTVGRNRTTSTGTGRSEGRSGREDRELEEWNRQFSEDEREASSEGENESVTRRTVQIPILGREVSSTEFRNLDEQLFLAMQKLFVQRDRHCAVRLVGSRAPAFLRTTDIPDTPIREARREDFLRRQWEKWPFFLSLSDAKRNIRAREEVLRGKSESSAALDDPITAKRRLHRDVDSGAK